VDFSADSSLSLVLVTDQGVDVEVNVAVLSGELLRDLFPEFVAVGPWSDVDDCWLDMLVDVSHGLFEALVSIYLHAVGVCLKERDECRRLFVVLLDLLRKDG